MKKLGLVIALLVLFSFLPGVIGCAKQPTPPTTPTVPTTPTTPTAPTTPKAEQPFKPIKLKYSDQRNHRPGYFGTLPEPYTWQKSVEAMTNGRITFENYPSQSLFPQSVAWESISKGIADVGYGGLKPAGIMVLDDVTSLPPLHGETTAVENEMIWWFMLWDTLEKDYAKMNLTNLARDVHHPFLIVTAKKPIRTVAEFKGVTVMATARPIIQLFTSVGAIVVPISNVEGFEALQKGIADGGVWNWEGPAIFGWWDAFKPGYYIDAGGVVRSGAGSNAIMNREKLASIPADLRETFEYLTWRWFGVYFSFQDDAVAPLFKKEAEKKGIQYLVWSDEEKAKLNTYKVKLVDTWIEEIEKFYKRGAEAAEIVKMYNAAASKYIPPAPVPLQVQAGGTQAEWDKVFGPGSTWGMGYKAYPNQIGFKKLEGNEFRK